MAERKPFLGPKPSRPELEKLIKDALKVQLTDEILQEQRISFAFGNAPRSAKITKDSVREASKRFRITG